VSMQRLTDEEVLACQAPVSANKPLIEDLHRHECQMCGEQLKSAEFLKSHVDLHLTSNPGEIKCAFGKCNLIFSSPVMLKEHREEHYRALRVSCELCSAVFEFKFQLKVHMQRHNQERPLACDVPGCTYTCRVPQRLRSHQKNVHHSIVCTCHLCGKKIKAYSFKSHMKIHNTETPGVYKCYRRNCKFLFQNGHELQKHIKEVHPEGPKPFQCDVCRKYFATKFWLRGHVVSHMDLRPFKCDVKGCLYSGKTKGNVWNHKNRTHSNDLFTCSYCGLELKTSSVYKCHSKRHMTDTPGVMKCLINGCKKTFPKAIELRNHVDQHGFLNKFACEICGQFNASTLLLKKHMLQHQVGKIVCPTPGCTFVSNTFTKMHYHRKNVHKFQHETTCQICGQGCYSATQAQQHADAHKTESEGVFKCLQEDCQETFTVPLESRTHMKQHVELHECGVADCLFTSKSQSDLQFHKITAHSIWQFNCQLCGKGVEKSKNLPIHMKSHETGEPGVIKCNMGRCKRTFTAAVHLKKHMACHSNSFLTSLDYSRLDLQAREDPQRKANECPMCGKTIKVKSQFRMHLVKHETQIPGVIKCIYKGCNETFTSASDLREHSRHHSEERSNACDVPGCNFATTTETLLVLHKRGMHSPALWKCYACGKIYKNKSYVMRHINSVHKKQQSVDNANPSAQGRKIVKEQHALVCAKMRSRKLFLIR
jgi:KRAB domain-containing zinc finger protein